MADGGTRRRDQSCTRAAAPERRRVVAVALVLVLTGALSACAGGGPVGDDAAADTVASTTNDDATPTTDAGVPGSPTTPPTTLAADDPHGARLRVTQDLTSCCYPAGHLSWLLVLDPDGSEVLQRRVRPPADPFPLLDQVLPAGRYHLVSGQQVCAGTCAAAGDAVDRCEADVDLAAGSTNHLTVGVAPGGGCAIVLAAAPLPSPIADEVALPGAALDCGFDASLAEAAATGDNVVLSDARRCLVAAADRGDPAWLEADEGDDGSRPGAGAAPVVYRLSDAGGVTVYQVVDPSAPVWVWVRSTCTDLVPDDVRGFLVQGCAAAEPVPWVAIP